MENEFFTSINWSKEDLNEVFEKFGIPATEHNIQVFLDSNAPRCLQERSTEEGWEILDVLVSDMENSKQFKENNDCPLCNENSMEYRNVNDTHMWVCNQCPAILLEYYERKNIDDLIEGIK